MEKQEISGPLEEKKIPIDLNKVYITYSCPECFKKKTVTAWDVLSKTGKAFNCTCKPNIAMLADGSFFTTPAPYKIVNILRDNMQRHTKHYKEDFIRDESILNNYEGSFLWGCRESGTDLVMFDVPNRMLDDIMWIVGIAYYDAYKNSDHSTLGLSYRSNVIFYWDGADLFKVSPDEAIKLWEDHILNVNL